MTENLAYVTYRAYCWKNNLLPASREEFSRIFAEGAKNHHQMANYDYEVKVLAEITAEFVTVVARLR